MKSTHSFARWWMGLSAFVLCVAPVMPVSAAGTLGNKKVLGIRVNFKDKKAVTSKDQVTKRLQAAKNLFGAFSYGKLTLTFEVTPVFTLAKNRSQYNGSQLANAAEAAAKKAGYNINSYHIIGFFYQGGTVGAHATVGGKRFWAPNNAGATLHEMGHNFSFAHQSAWDPNGDHPMGGGAGKNDPWQFMTNGTIHPDPTEKWRAKWLTKRYDITANGKHTKRIYTFDQKNTSADHPFRTMRIKRKTENFKHLWVSYRSKLHDNMNGAGKNYAVRQGLAVYWQKQPTGSGFLLDMHPKTGHLDDHTLQPGETFSDNGGGVHITNLGRGGESPNEYIDVQVNRGDFAGNKAPAPTWDLPSSWKTGVPLKITIQGNDPDGDEVSVMWKFSDNNLSRNTSASVVSRTWTKTGTITVTAVVSDMKGKTATLKKKITVTKEFPTYHWTGATSTSWGTVENWNPEGSPNERSEVAVFSGQFKSDNQPGFTSDKSLRALVMSANAKKDVAITLLTAETVLDLYEDGLDMTEASQSLTLLGVGLVRLSRDQVWKVGPDATLIVATALVLNGHAWSANIKGTLDLGGTLTGQGSVIKSGLGTLIVSGESLTPGSLEVKAGTLMVSGAVSVSSGLSVASGARLSGAGVVSSPVTISENGKLAPGDGIGALTLTAGVILAGDLVIEVDTTGDVVSDQLILSGAPEVTPTARVVIENLGPALVAGTVFPIFDTAIPGTDAFEIVGTLPKGLFWENRLAIDGTLLVTDFDECAGEGGGNDCHENAGCSNSEGGFVCACLPGYVGDGYSCEDADECALETDTCDPHATCANTDGGFTCTCIAGFSGDGTYCEDDDECALESDDCHTDALCENSPGSFTCACLPGYVGDGKACEDVDECAESLDDCDANATCTNAAGSFACACDVGFFGDGLTCCEDGDGDAVCDAEDNCPAVANADQQNTDGDLLGDACECPEALVCEDDNPCTADSCDPATGCVFANQEGPCDDGNPCTATSCVEGVCAVESTVDGCCFTHEDCGDPALICDPGTRACIASSCAPCETEADCGDGNACAFLSSGNYCTLACSDDAMCPEGTRCAEVSEDDRQCVPISGDCQCMPTAETVCVDGAVHVLDSCGGAGLALETCGERGCGGGSCCPEGSTSVDGSCVLDTPPPDVATPGEAIIPGGEVSGCVAQRDRGSPLGLLLMVLWLVVAVGSGRRKSV